MLGVQEKVRLAISEKNIIRVYTYGWTDIWFSFVRVSGDTNTASLDACVLLAMNDGTHTHIPWDRWSSKESRNEIFLSQKKKNFSNTNVINAQEKIRVQ